MMDIKISLVIKWITSIIQYHKEDLCMMDDFLSNQKLRVLVLGIIIINHL